MQTVSKGEGDSLHEMPKPILSGKDKKNDINLLSAKLVQSGEGQGNNADPARCTQIRLPSLFAIQKIIATDHCQIVQFLEQQ